MKTFNEVIADAGKLKPLPHTAAKLAAVIADEKSTIDDVAAVIRFDQTLSAEVLKMANSAFSAASRSIGEVREAVIRLGGGRILEMIVSKRVRSVMAGPLEQYGYDESDLWRHSVASALAAENLGRYVKVPISGISYTAALLHDIGKLLMIQVVQKDDIRKILDTINGKRISWAEAEAELFGFTHADIGAHIAKLWALPVEIETAIRYHNTFDTDVSPITDCVRVANIVARAIGQGIGYEGMGVSIDSAIAERLKLSRENFELLCAETAVRFKGVLALYET